MMNRDVYRLRYGLKRTQSFTEGMKEFSGDMDYRKLCNKTDYSPGIVEIPTGSCTASPNDMIKLLNKTLDHKGDISHSTPGEIIITTNLEKLDSTIQLIQEAQQIADHFSPTVESSFSHCPANCNLKNSKNAYSNLCTLCYNNKKDPPIGVNIACGRDVNLPSDHEVCNYRYIGALSSLGLFAVITLFVLLHRVFYGSFKSFPLSHKLSMFYLILCCALSITALKYMEYYSNVVRFKKLHRLILVMCISLMNDNCNSREEYFYLHIYGRILLLLNCFEALHITLTEYKNEKAPELLNNMIIFEND